MFHHHARCKICEKLFCCVDHRRIHEFTVHKSTKTGFTPFKNDIRVPNPLRNTCYSKIKHCNLLNQDNEEKTKLRLLRKRKMFGNEIKCKQVGLMQPCNKSKRQILVPVYRHKKVQKMPSLEPVVEESQPELSIDSRVENNVNACIDATPKQSNEVGENVVFQARKLTDLMSPGQNVFTSTPILSEPIPDPGIINTSDKYETPGTHFSQDYFINSINTPQTQIKSVAVITPIISIDYDEQNVTADQSSSLKRKVSFDNFVYESLDESKLNISPHKNHRGIFSAVAHAFRSAFQRFPGGGQFCYFAQGNESDELSWAVACSPSGRKRIRTINPQTKKISGRPTYQKNRKNK